jgi:Glycosyl transferase family 11
MLGLTLQGQLGNQMFQYAAARVQAERLKCGLVIYGDGFAPLDAMHRPVRHQIFESFPSLPIHPATYGLRLLKSLSDSASAVVWKRLLPLSFRPRCLTLGDNEPYDAEIWQIRDGTWLAGWFQSASYFANWEDKVRHWYCPSKAVSGEVQEIIYNLPESPGDMIAVHVRLGDYLSQLGSYADSQTGWALPKKYYERALAKFPRDAPIALFSDDIGAAKALLPRPPSWVSQATSATVDLFLMSSFPQLIIANSSFSWWAAWLNQHAARIIVAPKYHVGWREHRWFPADIGVEGWAYVEAQND